MTTFCFFVNFLLKKTIFSLVGSIGKKNGMLRMIVDGRQPNQYHRLSPHTNMASVEALAAVHVGAEWRHRFSPGGEPAMWAASVDLRDGFHQFLIPHLAEWFVMDLPGLTADDLGLTEVFDGDRSGFVPVQPDAPVWATYGGMAMGWA